MILKTNFRIMLLACAAAIAVLGSMNRAHAEGMIGSWTISVSVDEKAVAESLSAVEEQQKQMFQILLPAMKNMTGTLDVRQDGTYLMSMKMSFLGQQQTNKEEGTWKLVKQDGKNIVVETTEKGTAKAQSHDITWVNEDLFREAAPKEMGPFSNAFHLEYRRKE